MIALEKIFPTVPNFLMIDAFLTKLYEKNQIKCRFAQFCTTSTIGISKTLIFFKKRSGKDFLLTGSCFLHPRATQMCWKTLGTFKTHLASVPEGGDLESWFKGNLFNSDELILLKEMKNFLFLKTRKCTDRQHSWKK